MKREPTERVDLRTRFANEGMCLFEREDGTLELWQCDRFDDDGNPKSHFTGLTFLSVQYAYDYVFGQAHFSFARPLWTRG
jgi:hypothetical protein